MNHSLQIIQILSVKNQTQVADKCHVAERFFDRLKGLLGTKSLPEGEGLFIPRCNNIHMWFMNIPLDVVFVTPEDKYYRVTSIREGVRPWRVLPVWDSGAQDTLELPVGTIRRCQIQAGDLLCLS